MHFDFVDSPRIFELNCTKYKLQRVLPHWFDSIHFVVDAKRIIIVYPNHGNHPQLTWWSESHAPEVAKRVMSFFCFLPSRIPLDNECVFALLAFLPKWQFWEAPCPIQFWSWMNPPFPLLALWGNKNWPPSMKVKKMENFRNKSG